MSELSLTDPALWFTVGLGLLVILYVLYRCAKDKEIEVRFRTLEEKLRDFEEGKKE